MDEVERFTRALPRDEVLDLSRKEVVEAASEIQVATVVAYRGAFHALVREPSDDTHAVQLRVHDDGHVDWNCDDCKYLGGRACAHVIAAALAIHDHGPDVEAASRELRGYLDSLSKDELVELMLRSAVADTVLMECLRLAAAARKETFNPADFIVAIDACSERDSFGPDEGRDRGRAIEGVAAGLRAIADSAEPRMAVKLISYAIQKIGGSESFGDHGAFPQFTPLLVTAVRRGGLAGAPLAKHLWQLSPGANMEGWGHLLAAHRDLLGDEGLGTLVTLAEQEAAKPAPRSFIEQLDSLDELVRQRRLEALATIVDSPRCLADIRAKVRLKKIDDYHDIAKICAASPRGRDVLLEWARKGLERFPSDEKLLKHALDATAGRGELSIEVLWSVYDGGPSRPGFAALRKAATDAKCWDAWRDRAVQRAAGDRNLHTLVLMEDQQAAAAWDVALGGRVARETSVELASRHGEPRPAEAVAILQREIEHQMSGDGWRRCDDSAFFADRIRTLMALAKPPLDFAAFVRDLWAKWVRRSETLRRELKSRGITAKDGRAGGR